MARAVGSDGEGVRDPASEHQRDRSGPETPTRILLPMEPGTLDLGHTVTRGSSRYQLAHGIQSTTGDSPESGVDGRAFGTGGRQNAAHRSHPQGSSTPTDGVRVCPARSPAIGLVQSPAHRHVRSRCRRPETLRSSGLSPSPSAAVDLRCDYSVRQRARSSPLLTALQYRRGVVPCPSRLQDFTGTHQAEPQAEGDSSHE